MRTVKKNLKTKESLQTIRNLQHAAQRRNAIHRYASPWGVDTDIMDRLSKEAKDDWDNVHRHFNRFKAMVRAHYNNSDYGSDPLLVLEVKPHGPHTPHQSGRVQRGMQFPTTKPPNSETPWHITIDFSSRHNRREMQQLIDKYSTWKEYTLVGEISRSGGSFQLDRHRCEIASDPLVQLHDGGYYGDRGLHISL